LFRGTVCKLRPVFGLQLALFAGVSAADVGVDSLTGVVLFVPRDGVQVAACVAWGVQLVSGWGYPRGLVHLYWLRTWSLEVWHIDQYKK